MKYILRGLMLCGLLLTICFESAFAENGDSFYLVFPCESGNVVAAEVSEWYGYMEAKIHVRYKPNRLAESSGDVLVSEIQINGEPCSFEKADADVYASGSGAEYGYRITEFSGETVENVSVVVTENLADGERTHKLDLMPGRMKGMNEPAIVRALGEGCVYDAPSSSGTAIGNVRNGTKLTAYFTTDDGWTAIGVGSREVELWGYMQTRELYFGEEEICELTSDIEQFDVNGACPVYGDAACASALYDVREGDYVSILGGVGDVSFIQTGAQYGYVPTELLRSHSSRTSTEASFVYKADVRHALVTISVSRDEATHGRIAAEIEVTPQYTVNDDIKSLAVYINGGHRYSLSEENDFSMELPNIGEIASLVVEPVWASGGELVEDSVIVPVPDSGDFQ